MEVSFRQKSHATHKILEELACNMDDFCKTSMQTSDEIENWYRIKNFHTTSSKQNSNSCLLVQIVGQKNKSWTLRWREFVIIKDTWSFN